MSVPICVWTWMDNQPNEHDYFFLVPAFLFFMFQIIFISYELNKIVVVKITISLLFYGSLLSYPVRSQIQDINGDKIIYITFCIGLYISKGKDWMKSVGERLVNSAVEGIPSLSKKCA